MCELRMTLDLQQVENTLWFDMGAAPTEASLITLNNALVSWWTDFYAPLVAADVELVEVACTSMDTATGPQIILPPPAPLFGLVGQPALPNSVSLTISFRTASRGRSFRGRNYIVGLTETQVTNNQVTDAVANSWQDAYAELLGFADTPGDSWVVASRFSGVDPLTKAPIPRVTGIATQITSVVVVDKVVDNQRRRLPKRGN
jgi:hypothetical protein